MSETLSYRELLAQREALDRQISEMKTAAVADAIAKARAIVAEYGLTVSDVFPGGRVRRPGNTGNSTHAAIKYRDPATGKTWVGRGKPPAWIKDKNRDDFLVSKSQTTQASAA